MSSPTVLVTGLGLMGGSLAAALTAAGWPVLLHHRRHEVALEAERKGFGRAVRSFAEASEADLAVVAAPVPAIPEVVRALVADTDAIITDVGSTKGWLCAQLADLSARYVGSHPMAGSHRQGLDNAEAQLYRDRVAIVTPTPGTPTAALDLVERLWTAVGSRVVRMAPAAHDAAVAQASHVPHVLANAAAAACGDAALAVTAGGFRDTTRVAAASPELWADILLTNREAVGQCLGHSAARLALLKEYLAGGDRDAVIAWLADGQRQRLRFEAMQSEKQR